MAASSSRSYAQIARENLFTFINLVLFGLGLALIALGRVSDALVSVGVAGVNVLVSVAQEVRAKRALDRIALLTRPTATILRGDAECSILPEEVVPGDVLVLRPGDQAVADGSVLDGRAEMDESLLTGEADPAARGVGDRLYSGSFCTAGSLFYRAEAVGAASVAGRLAGGARAYRRTLTPLQREIHLIVRAMLLVAAFFELLLLVDAVVNGRAPVESVQDAVVVAGVVPIGLFLAVATAYAVGAVRLAGRGVLVQAANAVESLSHVDVLCLDKTGTLTANALRLHDLHPLDGTEADVRRQLGAFAASVSAPNRTSAALARACQGRRVPITEEVPFSSARKWSALAVGEGAGRRVYVLGAPEVLGAALPPGVDLAAAHRWAAQGLRVLLFAAGPATAPLHDRVGAPAPPAPLRALGVVALADELRPEARRTLDGLARAGVAVKVISGDSSETVAALARQAGVAVAAPACSGPDLALAGEDDIGRIAEGGTVFGRVTPEQKARLVRALRRRGHHVAMIGDGVNDVLALKQADLGVAMRSGSAATRAVADLILIDDSFAPLPLALVEGQRIRNGMYDILKLFLTRILFTVLLLLATATVSDAFPFAPKQHSILTLLTGGIPALAFAAWARSGRVAGHGDLRSLGRFVAPAAATMALVGLGVLVAALLASRHAYLAALPGATPADMLRHIEPVAQSALTAFAVLCGLLLIVFVAPPTPAWAGGAALSPDPRPALLALALLGAYVVALVVPPLRTFFDLAPLPAGAYVLIALAVAIWAALARWAWRARVLERLLTIDAPP